MTHGRVGAAAGPEPTHDRTEEPLPEEGVAVIGMAGRFPGASDVDALWRMVVAGEVGATAYTDEELAAAGVPRRLIDDPATVKSGFPLADHDRFDAEFFGITRTEAELMDPQHRLLLETAWQALERAGHRPDAVGARTGVFAGVAGNDYLRERAAPAAAGGRVSDEIQLAVGNDPGMLALRISHRLGLTGPSLTVQSACSSSLVAVHLAVQSLLARESDMALAGGVAVREFEPRGYRHEEGAILSEDGRCRPFDAAATGTVSGDGVALVVLKRLADAVADGDHVHAVIRGSAVNNDGGDKVGFTAPSERGQAEVVAEALAVAGVEPDTVQYVEAHGTATPLGDPIEVRALTEVFGPDLPAGSVHLGSVKSNVGHLDAAAGVTGLVKAVLALEHRHLPPTAHFREPNPELDLDKGPFRVDATGVPWPPTERAPRAGVSAFGIGGTNAHVVLEAAPSVAPAPSEEPDWQVLPLSARTPQDLDAAAGRLADALEAGVGASLADTAHTLQAGRAPLAHRRTVVAADPASAAAALRRSAGGADTGGTPDGPGAPDVVFLFPGQGAQYPGMGAELHRDEPAFREAFDACADVLRPLVGWDPREVVFTAAADDPAARERLSRTGFTQPAVFAVDYALAHLLMSWGVRPDAMGGHSLGELVSGCLAGVFSLEDALRVVARRAELMAELPPGRMLSVLLDEDSLTSLLDGREATVAAVNAPGSCVVGGTEEEIAELRRELTARGVSVRELQTSHAFHTRLVEPALPGLAEVLRPLRLRRPEIPFLSNVTGTWITDEQATDPEYWVAHTRRPVRFADGVRTLARRGPAVLVEVGPGSQLTGLVRAHEGARQAVPLLPRTGGTGDAPAEGRTAREGLAALWRGGVAVDWPALHRGVARRRVPLPAYPFAGPRHMLPRAEPAGGVGVRRDPARWTYTPVWHPAPPLRSAGQALNAAPGAAPEGWLVLADERGLADGVSRLLRAHGHRVVTVRRGTAYERTAQDRFAVDPANSGELPAVIRELRSEGYAVDRVLHAWSVLDHAAHDEAAPDHAAERCARALDAGFHTLVELAQTLGETGEERAVRVDVVTDRLQDAHGTPVLRPERATVHGAVTVLPQEYAWLSCRAVDVDLGPGVEPAEVARRLAAELAGPGAEPLVAHRGGQRLRRAFAPVTLPPAAGDARAWREGAGYLVTGVSGEAGLSFAEHLARIGARLLLVSDPPDTTTADTPGDSDTASTRRHAERLRALLEAHPDTVSHRVADLCEPDEARSVVAEAAALPGGLRGVLHMPHTRGSGLVALKSRRDFEAVLAARVRALLLLEELLAEVLAERPLDFLLVGSATTGVVGGFGQSENTAAAAFVDAHAHAGAARGRHVVALDVAQWEWDDWFEQQMAGLPEVRALYERLRHEQGVATDDGVTLARAALAAGLPQVVVSRADFQDVLADQAQLTAASFTDNLHGDRGDDNWDPATVWPDDEVAQAVARVWRDMLGVSPIGPDDDFYELGGNSLFAIQIVGRLRQEYGDFPMSAVFEAPTVPALASAIRAHQAEAIGLDEFEALLREVEGLSADEAEAKLRGEV
ncbi:type I polyketide synthase [Streptomyces alkaliterrae]|uniref:Acyltransferase domain-containing protein n=1 Tax=Streptomyces alkaliterrae TaxID=2213162 RepID=A0A5P0YNM2_9ACTN|nr:type I polyketide synthase [Streptomyces alkaliterrae]MBB1257767.1 acyltransferase domain-containing protein [Streptomyces alkaliterrae]MQS01267.1 acyltransferase domain-containing protein [Streptomyces alkaliterrae]